MIVLDVGVTSGGFQAGVTKQLFYCEKVNALFQKMCCKTVTQGMNRGLFVKADFFFAFLKAA